jgi:hypothetical protein
LFTLCCPTLGGGGVCIREDWLPPADAGTGGEPRPTAAAGFVLRPSFDEIDDVEPAIVVVLVVGCGFAFLCFFGWLGSLSFRVSDKRVNHVNLSSREFCHQHIYQAEDDSLIDSLSIVLFIQFSKRCKQLYFIMMGVSVSAGTVDLWTTCHSFAQRKHFQEFSDLAPPSQWEQYEVEKYCFLSRHITDDKSQYSSLAPGTALFQHWLSDFGRNENSSWDPLNEFPTWQVMKQYPDISDDGQVDIGGDLSSSARDYYTLWYTASISANDEDQSNSTGKKIRRKRGHLTLHGVNYQPLVYYGGDLLLPYSTFADRPNETVDLGGMFLRRHYDIGLLNRELDLPLEILVLPPPVVGKPTDVDNKSMRNNQLKFQLKKGTSAKRKLGSNQRDKENEPQGQGGDHDLAQSGAIMQCSAGWDWIQSTPDRNTGIWDKVQVDWICGDVKLHDVRVQVAEISANEIGDYNSRSVNDTDALPIGNGVLVDVVLNLSVTTTLHTAQNDPVMGKFQYQIKEVGTSTTVASGTFEHITINQTVSEVLLGAIQLIGAKLWWPHTHGSQPLYSASITFQSYEVDDNESSMHETQTESTFGIRTISSYTHPLTKSLTVRVNGHSIFLTGGNWVTTDQFLRFSTSRKRYTHELLHLKNIGFNAIRVWGGGIAETEEFYNAADRLGLLVYQEFWMTGTYITCCSFYIGTML